MSDHKITKLPNGDRGEHRYLYRDWVITRRESRGSSWPHGSAFVTWDVHRYAAVGSSDGFDEVFITRGAAVRWIDEQESKQ